jgi:ATP-dependent Lhr-like helicase
MADNFAVRVQGEGLGLEAVRAVIREMAVEGFWSDEGMRKQVLAMLPEYRLSKFQRALPERWQVEMVGEYLVDFGGAGAWLRADLVGNG